MPDAKLISSVIKISHLTQLNTYLLEGAGAIIYADEKVSIPAYMPGAKRADVFHIYQNMAINNQVYNYHNEWGLSYLGYSFSEGGRRCSIIVGPYLETTLNPYQLALQYKLSNQEYTQVKENIEKIKVFSPGQVASYEAVLQQFEAIRETDTERIVIYGDQTVTNGMEERTEEVSEADLVEERYRIEKEFMRAVEQGKTEAAIELISSDNMLFSFSERFPQQPLRRLKNLSIILNTILRIAARNAQVPALTIHQISEKFAYTIEGSENVAAARQIQDKMIRTYCDLIKMKSLYGYSPIIQRVIEHIVSFYNQAIDYRQLAARHHIHPKHLARRFKQETGMTISEYQKKLRLDQAKYLLKTDNLPIEEIAWSIGYQDASYFARVFKEATGFTPSAYRLEK